MPSSNGWERMHPVVRRSRAAVGGLTCYLIHGPEHMRALQRRLNLDGAKQARLMWRKRRANLRWRWRVKRERYQRELGLLK